MNEEPRPKANPLPNAPSPPARAKRLSTWLPVFVLCAVFLVGFVPMWLKSNRLGAELFRAQREARIEQIQITFANAALDARRGDYEPARQGMTSFFNLVTAELDRGMASALPAGAAADLKPLLGQRDELITLLARSDPASAERLANAYASFRQTLGR
jgi:hypothetical protein